MSPSKFDVFSNLPEAMVEETLGALPSRTDQTGEVLLKDKQANIRIFLIEGGERDVGKGEPDSANGVKRVTLKAGNGFGERSAINGATANIGAARRTDGPRAKLQRADRLKALAGHGGRESPLYPRRWERGRFAGGPRPHFAVLTTAPW